MRKQSHADVSGFESAVYKERKKKKQNRTALREQEPFLR